jgi:hypothetical protein
MERMATSKQLLARIRALGPMVHGSLVEAKRTCGKKGCRCTRGEPHTAFYLSRRFEGKTRLEHVSRNHVKLVGRWRKEHDRLLALVEELTTALLQELREPKE